MVADELAPQLRALRERSGKTLRELQAVTYASDSALSRYLAGRTVPPWQVVAALCEQARTDPAELRPLWQRARAYSRRRAPRSALARELARVSAEVSAAIHEARSHGERVPEQLLASAQSAARQLTSAVSEASDGGTK